jgi:NAD-dependent dihydropyrimidine dehydrogenase PreA subunit
MNIMELKEMKNDTRRLHKVKVNNDVCMGCMKCVRTCCYGIYKWDKENKQPIAAYPEECVACLQCMYYCPSGAIEVEQATLAFFDPLYDTLGLTPKEGGK